MTAPIDLADLESLEREHQLGTASFVSYEGPIGPRHRASVCLGNPLGRLEGLHSCLADIYGATEDEACARADAVAQLLAAFPAIRDELHRLRARNRELETILASAPHRSIADDGTEIVEWIGPTTRFGISLRRAESESWFYVEGDGKCMRGGNIE
jgi:hypothetical protein